MSQRQLYGTTVAPGVGLHLWRYHGMVASDLAKGMDSILSEEEEVRSRVISTSLSCAAAIAPKSMNGGELLAIAEIGSIRERASAGALALPLTCRISEVNSAIKLR